MKVEPSEVVVERKKREICQNVGYEQGQKANVANCQKRQERICSKHKNLYKIKLRSLTCSSYACSAG
jgi:hypothetical protein